MGAMRAISRPAAALEMPSQVFALSPPGCASPTTPRTTYGPKTNEVMTAEYAEDPQSPRQHNPALDARSDRQGWLELSSVLNAVTVRHRIRSMDQPTGRAGLARPSACPRGQ